MEIAKPEALKETPEEKQELEEWLSSEHYIRYYGKVTFVEGYIFFRLGEEKNAYPDLDEDSSIFGNYVYWNVDKFRIVRLKDTGKNNRYYVKM